MELEQVIAKLKEIKPGAVMVTGPQRSGTTIAGHIIASELGMRYVDEMEFGVHDGVVAGNLMKAGGVVVQAPGLMHIAHECANINVPVVVMRRELKDIRKSEDRVNWRTEYGGLNLAAECWKYEKMFGANTSACVDDIARVKYQYWDTMQKQHCVSFDLDYESMRTHGLWKDAQEREKFGAKQIA